MAAYIVIDGEGLIVNRILLNEDDHYDVPGGLTLVEETQPMEIGATYKDGVYMPLPPPPIEPAPLPYAVSAAQARLALLSAGLLASVQAAVNQADEATQIWFEYATEWRRDNTILNALGVQLGLSSDDIDALFMAAASL